MVTEFCHHLELDGLFGPNIRRYFLNMLFRSCQWSVLGWRPAYGHMDVGYVQPLSTAMIKTLGMGLNCGLRMRRECRERFPRHWLQLKPLVSDPGMHHGTCVTHVPWCMSGLLTRGGGGNVPGIPGACATHNFKFLARGLYRGYYNKIYCTQ